MLWWLARWTFDLEVGGSSLYRRVVSLDKKPYFTLPLFTQMYKWVLAIAMLGGEYPCEGLTSHQEGVAIFLVVSLMLQKPELSGGLMGHLARKQTLPIHPRGGRVPTYLSP